MSTATDLGTEALEEIDFHEVRRCEHPIHRTDTRHADGNELFVRWHCPVCGPSPVAVRCGSWVSRCNSGQVDTYCGECRSPTPTPYIILGPANGDGS